MRRLLYILTVVAFFVGTFAAYTPAEAVSRSYCSTITRCMNVSYYSEWYGSVGNGTLPLDNKYPYWDSTAWDATNQWSFPSTCLNQAAIDAAGNAGLFPLPACAQDPNYVETFINTIAGFINDPGYVCVEPLAPIGAPLPPCAYTQRQALGAAMIVNTMMGVDPLASFVSPQIQGRVIEGVTSARNLFPAWSSLVRSYNSAGLVDWNFKTVEQPDHINSTYQPLNMRGYQWGQDDVFFINPNIYPVAEIKFSTPSGVLYEINRRCGNINGAVNPFPSFNVSPTLQSGPGTPPGGIASSPGGPLQSGTPYDVRPGAWNAGPGAAAPQTYILNIPGNVTPISYPGGSWDPAARTVTWTGVTINGTGYGSAAMKDFNFTVNAGTPNGTLLTFTLTTGPHDPSGGNAPPTSTTFVVQDPRYPAVRGDNGDIHAGGGVCDLPTTKGRAQGNAKASSGGQYVVSSSDLLNNVASNGSGDSLKLGPGGGYSRACRPDFLALADDYVAHGGKVNPLPCDPAACDFAITSATASGVYIYNGTSPMNIRGLVSNKITIVSKKAPVRINGPISLANLSYEPRNLPSLGVIAAGDISIPAAVTRVDAYLYSGSTIDTCAEQSSACATSPLLINGFIMGKNLKLNRIGAANSKGDQLAERIVLNPQIYLNPPAIFDAASVDGAPSGLGEMPPLF